MSQKYKILIVDDEKDLCEILEFNLMSEGFDTDTAYSAEEALEKNLESFNLILLDVMMGEMSGFKMAMKLRNELNIDVPIIFMTAKTTENDILTGFNVGADDYITKPFSIREMIARIKAVLKRGTNTTPQATIIKMEKMEIDIDGKTISIDKQPVNVTRKEFEILVLLVKNQGKYIERTKIIDQIWSDDVIVTDRNVDVNIARLRKKIGKYGKYIKGKSGYGYQFKI